MGMEEAEKTKGKRPAGQAPMGSVAEAAMKKLKLPVLLVKNNSGTTREINSVDGMLRRRARDAKAQMKIVCCVDGNSLSMKTFDMANHLCAQHDEV